MAFTYDISDPIGQVRFEIGDTDPSTMMFSNEEITYKLGEHSDVVFLAAAALCDVLSTRYAGEYDFKTDDQSFSRSQRSAMYADRATELRGRAPGGSMGTVGMTRVDGHSDDIDQREGSASAIDWAIASDFDKP